MSTNEKEQGACAPAEAPELEVPKELLLQFGDYVAKIIAEHRRKISDEVDAFTVEIRVQPNESDCGQCVANWDIAGPVGLLEHTEQQLAELCDRVMTRLRMAFDDRLKAAAESLAGEYAFDNDDAEPPPPIERDALVGMRSRTLAPDRVAIMCAGQKVRVIGHVPNSEYTAALRDQFNEDLKKLVHTYNERW